MARLLWDFECGQGHRFEELVPTGTMIVPCATCTEPAKRMLAAPRMDPKLGVSLDFPTMADKWARKHRQQTKHADRLKREHGDSR